MSPDTNLIVQLVDAKNGLRSKPFSGTIALIAQDIERSYRDSNRNLNDSYVLVVLEETGVDEINVSSCPLMLTSTFLNLAKVCEVDHVSE